MCRMPAWPPSKEAMRKVGARGVHATVTPWKAGPGGRPCAHHSILEPCRDARPGMNPPRGHAPGRAATGPASTARPWLPTGPAVSSTCALSTCASSTAPGTSSRAGQRRPSRPGSTQTSPGTGRHGRLRRHITSTGCGPVTVCGTSSASPGTGRAIRQRPAWRRCQRRNARHAPFSISDPMPTRPPSAGDSRRR